MIIEVDVYTAELVYRLRPQTGGLVHIDLSYMQLDLCAT